jgi:hypothetical protein
VVDFQKKVHFILRQRKDRGYLFRSVSTAGHAKHVAALAEVQPGLGRRWGDQHARPFLSFFQTLLQLLRDASQLLAHLVRPLAVLIQFSVGGPYLAL